MMKNIHYFYYLFLDLECACKMFNTKLYFLLKLILGDSNNGLSSFLANTLMWLIWWLIKLLFFYYPYFSFIWTAVIIKAFINYLSTGFFKLRESKLKSELKKNDISKYLYFFIFFLNQN